MASGFGGRPGGNKSSGGVAGIRDVEVSGKEGDAGSRCSSFCRSGAAGEKDEEDEDAPFCIVSSYAGFSKKGYSPHHPRKHNQDALIMAEDVSTASLFLAVMDGHGEAGEKVAQAFRHGLVPSVFHHPDWESSPESAVAESISIVERALLDSSVDTSLSGTTYTSVCVRGSKLVLTNVGDSRATLGRRPLPGEAGHGTGGGGAWGKGSLVAQALTEDHKPDIPAEKERILSAGGRVFSLEYSDGVDGPPRVWLADTDMPGLAMSRTLGDVVAHSVGVISDPDTYRCDISFQEQGFQNGADGSAAEQRAAVLILATDGLWEFVSDQEAVDIASECSEPRHAVQRLTHEATNRWMKEEQVVDDITVCVAFLNSCAGDIG